MDIVPFIRAHYSAEEIEAMSRAPDPRLGIILETLEQVRSREPSS